MLYLERGNPLIVHDKPIHEQLATFFWVLWSCRIIGPSLLENIVGETVIRYCQMITESKIMWLQQNYPTANFANATTRLKKKFNDRIISRNNNVNWSTK